jgi:hypothetical protein
MPDVAPGRDHLVRVHTEDLIKDAGTTGITGISTIAGISGFAGICDCRPFASHSQPKRLMIH